MRYNIKSRVNEILGEGHDLFQQPWRDEYLVACLLDSYLIHHVQDFFHAFECNKNKDFTIEGWDFVDWILPRSLINNCTFISCTFTGCVINPFYPHIDKILITGNTKFIRCHISQSNWKGSDWKGKLEFEDCTLQSLSLNVWGTLNLTDTLLDDSTIEGNPEVVYMDRSRIRCVKWVGFPSDVLIQDSVFSADCLINVSVFDSKFIRVLFFDSRVNLDLEGCYIEDSCFNTLKGGSSLTGSRNEMVGVKIQKSSDLEINMFNCFMDSCLFLSNTYSSFYFKKNVVTETFWENNVYKEGRIFDSEFENSSFKMERGSLEITDVVFVASEYLGCELEIDSQALSFKETIVNGSCFRNSTFDRFKVEGGFFLKTLFQECLLQDFEIMETSLKESVFYSESQGSLSGGVFSGTRFENTIFQTHIQRVGFFYTSMRDSDLTGSFLEDIHFLDGEFENNLYDSLKFQMVQGFLGD